MIDTYHLPETETHYIHTPNAPDCDLEFSVEDDAKLDRAAQWGRSLILCARAGDQQALADLRTKMHVTLCYFHGTTDAVDC